MNYPSATSNVSMSGSPNVKRHQNSRIVDSQNTRAVHNSRAVLIVDTQLDDQAAIDELIRRFSNKEQLRFFQATDFETARAVAKRIRPSIIIADTLTLDTLALNGSTSKLIKELQLLKAAEDTGFILIIEANASEIAISDNVVGSWTVDFIARTELKTGLALRVDHILGVIELLDELRLSNTVLRKRLETKEREIETLRAELYQCNEILMHYRKKVDESISSLAVYLNNEGKVKLSKLLKQFNSYFKQMRELSRERDFEQSNEMLYNWLDSICPTITRNEKKLCAFLLLRHSVPDIANITGKTQNSIHVALARLQAKLKLPNRRDLSGFLQSKYRDIPLMVATLYTL
jgi:hypothetical protein